MQLFAACALLLASAAPLSATLVRYWSVSDIENSPALVVATVESVTRTSLVPTSEQSYQRQERYWEATLRVLRVFPAGTFAPESRIVVRYAVLEGDPGSGFFVWPRFARGMTALIPLTPGSDSIWRLVAKQGGNLTVPAMEQAPRIAGAPSTGRAFILGELANTLANGGTAKRSEAAVYLRSGYGWPDGFHEALERAVGDDDDRWLEVAGTVLAHMGIPHSHMEQLMANQNLTAKADQEAAWLLAKGTKRDYPNRLIRWTLRNMPANDWGAANILLEFKDSPLVVRELARDLKSDPSNSIYAAWVLVRNGQVAFKGEALDAAVQLVTNPAGTPMNHLQAASGLLREFGSDTQFEVILSTLRRLKTTNEVQYRDLFGAVEDRQNKRVLLAAAILIDDRRLGWGERFRYCDVAAGDIDAIAGLHLGIKQEMTLGERDRAVAAASAWLKRQ